MKHLIIIHFFSLLQYSFITKFHFFSFKPYCSCDGRPVTVKQSLNLQNLFLMLIVYLYFKFNNKLFNESFDKLNIKFYTIIYYFAFFLRPFYC